MLFDCCNTFGMRHKNVLLFFLSHCALKRGCDSQNRPKWLHSFYLFITLQPASLFTFLLSWKRSIKRDPKSRRVKKNTTPNNFLIGRAPAKAGNFASEKKSDCHGAKHMLSAPSILMANKKKYCASVVMRGKQQEEEEEWIEVQFNNVTVLRNAE